MSAEAVYQQVKNLVMAHVDPSAADNSTVDRLCLLITGIIQAGSASPAKVAGALKQLGLKRGASRESVERQIRRMENDTEISASTFFHPYARQRLLASPTPHLNLILDPTLQEDRVVMVTIGIWYRGRALPIAWALWPANTPLEGDGFWVRIEKLLDLVKSILPAHTQVTWLADRAFGTPVFIDMLVQRHWHYVIRIQNHTRYQDVLGREAPVSDLLAKKSHAKMRGKVFKKAGWRENSVVIHLGSRHKSPLCVVSDYPPDWALLAMYRRRYGIEATFRDYKSQGWHWEQGQVTDLEHLERLLVAMAFALWIAIFVGIDCANAILSHRRNTSRRTRPHEAKYSLFQLGIDQVRTWFCGADPVCFHWILTAWDAPAWSVQLTSLVHFNYVFA